MKKIIGVITFILIVILFSSCGITTKQEISLFSKEEIFSSGNINEFAKSNLPTFEVFNLSNGIPVIVKKNPYNRIYNIKIVLKGGVALTTVDKAGIEKFTLAMLRRGSQKYNYDKMQKILSDTSSSISYSTLFDSSSYDLNTLDKYFDQVFDVFIDSFMNPAFTKKDYSKVRTDLIRAIQDKSKDPYSRCVNKLNKAFFEGHPYAAEWDGTVNSLALMKLEDIKEYYEKTFSSNRIFVIAVGNFDTEKLKEKLDSTLGTIKNKYVKIPDVPDFMGKVKSDLILDKYNKSEGLAYVRGDFAIPDSESPDYLPLRIGLAMLDDILFQIVRTEHSACYSAWAIARTFKANYGSIVIYKTRVPGEVKKYIDDSISHLLKGECLLPKISASAAGKGGLGKEQNVKEQKGNYGSIAEALDFYKAQFINSYFEGQQTNASIANQIEFSIIYHNDYRDYLLLIDQVNKVNPENIKKVIKKYLYDNKIMWAITGSSDILEDVVKDDYLNFIGNYNE